MVADFVFEFKLSSSNKKIISILIRDSAFWSFTFFLSTLPTGSKKSLIRDCHALKSFTSAEPTSFFWNHLHTALPSPQEVSSLLLAHRKRRVHLIAIFPRSPNTAIIRWRCWLNLSPQFFPFFDNIKFFFI